MWNYYRNRSLDNMSANIGGVDVIEEWKPIEESNGAYLISTFGRVKSMSRCSGIGNRTIKEKILLGYLSKGYVRYTLRFNNKSNDRFASRLVAFAFIPNPNNYPHVLHKVESIPSNDYVDNLWWGTHQMNMEDKTKKGRAAKPKGELSHLYGKFGALCNSSKIVLDTNTGIFYDSAKEAAEAKGIYYNTLRGRLNGNKKNNTSLIYV